MTARQAKQHFGEMVDRAMRGERVGITRNGRLVAVVDAAPARSLPGGVAEPGPDWPADRAFESAVDWEGRGVGVRAGWPPPRWQGASDDVPPDDLIAPAAPPDRYDDEEELEPRGSGQ